MDHRNPSPFVHVPLRIGDVVLREAENGVILLRVALDDSSLPVLLETVFEDRQPVTGRYIHADANPRIMSLADALRMIARDVLATTGRLGLFIGLKFPRR